MKPGDLVLSLNGEPVLNRAQIGDVLFDEKPDQIQMTILRNDQQRTFTLYPRLPERRPAEIEWPMLGLVWDEFGGIVFEEQYGVGCSRHCQVVIGNENLHDSKSRNNALIEDVLAID